MIDPMYKKSKMLKLFKWKHFINHNELDLIGHFGSRRVSGNKLGCDSSRNCVDVGRKYRGFTWKMGRNPLVL